MTTTALTLHRPAPAYGRTRKVCAALAIAGLLSIRCLLNDVSAAPSTNDASSAIAIYSILVDGRPRQIPAGMQLLSDSPNQPVSVGKVETGKLRVPSLAQRTEFRFGPNPSSSSPP